ncbi:ATP-binding cassette domain-containing protein [Pectinatus brassicae]|uniref:Heme exporter protein A n=1 Tax=Pectinatus brassicae TaxID=862415 RepID=A0A840UU07_9FIRM|nr:ATP-binding cassette domain-containing protein [Pectinatus brassicae]MBB5336304.1 heme exporter protein A [Pectinatus brassicae]
MGISIIYKKITQKFNDHELFNNLSGIIKPYNITVITGLNGAGKSTLSKILTGQLYPSEGKISYWQNDVLLPKDEFRNFLAVVSPEVYFYETMNAAENLKLLAGLAGKKFDNAVLKQVSEEIKLDLLKKEKLSVYSTGQRQRLKIALLLLIDRPVWLLDEPSSNLDIAGRELIYSLVMNGKKTGHTIIIASNDAQEVSYGDQHIALS